VRLAAFAENRRAKIRRATSVADETRGANGMNARLRIFLSILVMALACAMPCIAQTKPATAPAKVPMHAAKAGTANLRPKLVVILVVDQMRADYVEHFRQQWTGGLARLVNEGAWFRQAAYPYQTTVTCVGHTTISTGAFPVTHGVVGNGWYDRDEEGGAKSVTCTSDSHVKDLGIGGETSGGDSPARLRVDTFSDALREQSGGGTRVVAFSLKARAAITLAGHRADVVAWHDPRTGAWATSSFYGATVPEFMTQYVTAHPVSADYGKTWALALPESAYLYNDPPDGRHAPNGWTTSFPHPLRGLPTDTAPGPAFYTQWDASPLADAYLARMAGAAVDSLKLGQGASTDFVAVSFSALDEIGHGAGPHSREVQDILVNLDKDLGELFAHLDAKVGRGNYVVAFSADHGVAPVPEQSQRDGLGGGRISTAAIRRAINQLTSESIGDANAVGAIGEADISFTPGAYEKLRKKPEALDAIIHAIEATPGILRVFRPEELRPLPQTPDPILRAASLSYFPGRSGDLIFALKPYWISSADGTTHGTSNAYDQRVPLIFFGAGFHPGIFLSTASPADIAPTLAYLCGITLARVDGHLLTDAVAPNSPANAATPARPTTPH
jgi:predicted AlkP superfamily pyrophosphatase or phosphodiesterase